MSDNQEIKEAKHHGELNCKGCGAILKFKPGTHHLTCEYCGAENQIYNPEEHDLVIEETSLEEYFQKGLSKEEEMEVLEIRCDSCGGKFTFESTVSSGFCPFCDSPIVLQGGTVTTVFKPKYLLPFKLDRKESTGKFRHWLKSLWFAPSGLVSHTDSTEHFKGMYIPFWTYDCNTTTRYEGQRGDDYNEQVWVNVMENGKSVRKMQTVTKTRWSHASGTVYDTFDDVLVLASHSISSAKVGNIQSWDLQNLVPFNEKYLSGFHTESYTLKLEPGYEQAKKIMEQQINYTVRSDIGGDRQRIHRTEIAYADVTFKQILMPIWISSYRYKGKVYQFIINGRNGRISGDRPYSWPKILLAVLGAILVIFLISLFAG